MKRTLLLTFLLLSVSALCFSQKLVEVAKGYSCTSVNTTIFRNNSLVTHGDEQYISYYDADGYLVLGKRKLNSKQWTLHRTQYRGNVKDAHNIISIMVDGEGYLHVSFDHHGHKLNYCRSIAPGSLELGDKMPMTGVDEGNVTYPEFYPLTDGDLLFVYRSGSSGRGNLVMNRYSLKDHKWARVQDVLIDGEDKRNAYWQLYVDEKGTIHLSWVWRETRLRRPGRHLRHGHRVLLPRIHAASAHGRHRCVHGRGGLHARRSGTGGRGGTAHRRLHRRQHAVPLRFDRDRQRRLQPPPLRAGRPRQHGYGHDRTSAFTGPRRVPAAGPGHASADQHRHGSRHQGARRGAHPDRPAHQP